MFASIDTLVAGGDFVITNLLLQLTVFSLAAVVLASCYRNNAVVRYSILYTSLLSLTFLIAISLLIQSRSSSFLLLQLETPINYLDYLLPRLDGLFLSESTPVRESSSVTASASLASTGAPVATFFSRALYLIVSLPLYLILQILWLSGFLVSMVGLLRSLHNGARVVRRSNKLNTQAYSLFVSVINRSGFADAILRCRESAEIDSPVLVGIVDPILLVPNHFFERFSENDIHAILLHEMAHITRRDPFFNFLQKIILSLFWFHPLVHLMDSMVARAREEICDNYVLSQERATDYGEVLFRLNQNQSLAAAQSSEAYRANIGMGVIAGNWNLEQRIGGLLNQKREKLMRLSQRSKIVLNACVVATAFAVSACQVTAQDDLSQLGEIVGTGQNQSPDNTVYPTLSPQIQAKISEIEDLMLAESNSEPDWEGAKERLDELYEERFERMNDSEKMAVLNFYTNYYLSQESYEDATNTFEEMLNVELIRADMRLRILRSLGQLYAAGENWSESIRYYENWQADSAATDRVVFHGLSYAHYQLEQFDDALPTWISYMQMKTQDGSELVREDYSYLLGLHYTLENWQQALDVTKEMVLLFYTPKDWENLRAIYRKLDEAEQPSAA